MRDSEWRAGGKMREQARKGSEGGRDRNWAEVHGGNGRDKGAKGGDCFHIHQYIPH